MISEKLSIPIKAIAACLLWSTAFAGVKIGLNYTTPFFLAGIRFIIAGIILIPFSGHPTHYLKIIWFNRKFILSVASLQTAVMYGLYFTGINFVPGSIAAIIIGASPLVTAIITHFFLHDDKFSKDKLIAILLGVTGIILVVSGRFSFGSGGGGNIGGAVLLILSMIVSAFANIHVAKNSAGINPVLLNSIQLLVGGIILIFFSFPLEGLPDINWNIEFIVVLGWLSFLSAAAFSIWFSLLKTPGIKVSELNMWKFLIPVFGAVFSWILLPDESPSLISVIGMVIITMSIVLYYLPFSFIKNK